MNQLNRRIFLAALGGTALASGVVGRALAQAAGTAAPAGGAARPNILLILADDMGWSDIAPFGGADIATPNLDALAADGTRLTNFHVSPFCSPTRAMLLTGQDNHQIGLGNMIELIAPEQKGQPGYEGHLNERAVTVAQRLQEAGYRTMMAGKWHLGLDEAHSPAAWGFDRSFAMLRGESNHYPYKGKAPSPDGLDVYNQDGKETGIPADFYSTDGFVGHLNAYLDEVPQGTPFFAYLAFTAPHSPLQAPPELIAKYKGRYDAGPAALAEARMARAKELGLIPADAKPHAMVEQRDWAALTPEERAASSRRMEVYAAMIDSMDAGIGRVMDKLREKGALDNTLVVFLSDNGAAGALREGNPKWGPWIKDNFDNSLDNMGTGTSYLSTGSDWAQASMAPFALFKGFTTEGGTLSPVIVAGPGIAKGGISGRFAQVKDIAPTLLTLAGVDPAAPAGKAPVTGADLTPVLAKPEPARVGPDQPAVLELVGGRAVHKGDWKAVLITSRPSGLKPENVATRKWQLYNLAKDPGETTDLAAEQPQLLAELAQAYDAWAKENGVISLPGMFEDIIR